MPLQKTFRMSFKTYMTNNICLVNGQKTESKSEKRDRTLKRKYTLKMLKKSNCVNEYFID